MQRFWVMVIVLLVTAQGVMAQKQHELLGWVVTNYKNNFEDNGVNSFGFRNIRLTYKGAVSEQLSVLMTAEMVGTKDKRPVFLQGWLNYKFNENISARVGQFKYPFGNEAYPSLITWKFISASYATAGIANKLGYAGGSYRDMGAQLTANFGITDNMTLGSKIMVMNGNGINVGDDGGYKDYVFQTTLSMPMNIKGGLSLYNGTRQELIDLNESAVSVFFEILREDFTAKAEYLSATYEQGAGLKDITPAGYYAYGTYKFLPKWEAGLRYDSYNADTRADVSEKTRFTLSFGHYFTKTNRIMLNYEMPSGDTANIFMIQFYGIIE